MKNLQMAICAMAITLAVGCGGGDSGSALQGIYQVDTWTENTAGCDTPGASILGSQNDTFFYLKNESFFGVSFLNAKFCVDQAECNMQAGDAGTVYIGRFSFVTGSDSAGWLSELFFGSSPNNTCEGTYTASMLTSTGDTTVSISVTGTPASGFPVDTDGFCDLDAARQAAQGQPCASIETITATFMAPLP